jgi:hypothetical protein
MVIRVVIGGIFLLKVKRVQGSNASRSNAFGVQVLRVQLIYNQWL